MDLYTIACNHYRHQQSLQVCAMLKWTVVVQYCAPSVRSLLLQEPHSILLNTSHLYHINCALVSVVFCIGALHQRCYNADAT